MDWGRNKAKQRYAEGGDVDRSTGSPATMNSKSLKDIPGPSSWSFRSPTRATERAEKKLDLKEAERGLADQIFENPGPLFKVRASGGRVKRK